jgi:hypothetical protein
MNPTLLGKLAFLTPLLARAGNTRLFADDLCRWRVRECQRSSEICFISKIEPQGRNRHPIVFDCPAVGPFRGAF